MQMNSAESVVMARRRSDGGPPSATPGLVARIRAGDVDAFEELMVLHERQVLATACRLLGHLDDAQDAAQEVFLRLYKYLVRFDEARELSPWLYRVTVNVCRDMARKRPKPAVLSLEDIAVEDIPDPVDSDAIMVLLQHKQIVAHGLKLLPEKERAAVVLRDMEGLSTKEVARILGSTEMTVRSQVSRARVKMKRFIEGFLRRNRPCANARHEE